MEGLFIIAIGVILIYVAIQFQSRTKQILKKGIQTKGVIFDILGSDNPDSSAMYPLVRFVTSENVWITEKYNISTIPGLLKKGQKVTVIYNPDNPKEFIIKSPINSFIPKFLIALSIVILAAGIYKLLHVKF